MGSHRNESSKFYVDNNGNDYVVLEVVLLLLRAMYIKSEFLLSADSYRIKL